MVTRHEFLASLHELLKPKCYLEVGVQYGTSLRLAGPDTIAWGIDPNPLCTDLDHAILRMTSDQFFGQAAASTVNPAPIDLGFIDGMHLVEYALRGFIGMERLSSPPGGVVFDDVLPRNQAEAAREQCPGDWTGDVWRIEEILAKFRLDLDLLPVDTLPTGLLVVTHLDPDNRRLTEFADDIASRWPEEDTVVPAHILDRRHAWRPDAALEAIATWWRIVSAQPTQQEVVP